MITIVEQWQARERIPEWRWGPGLRSIQAYHDTRACARKRNCIRLASPGALHYWWSIAHIICVLNHEMIHHVAQTIQEEDLHIMLDVLESTRNKPWSVLMGEFPEEWGPFDGPGSLYPTAGS